MAADFSRLNPHRLLLGNEAGDVTLVDTRRQSGDTLVTLDLQTYPDAIFDLVWQRDDSSYALAVADNHVYIHDAVSGVVKQCLGFHDSSVRTVRYRPNSVDVLATAGRDGSIALWDLRMADTNSAKNQPINVIPDAHLRGKKAPSSVTAIEFMPLADHLLASIGQPDYAVRFWDMRYTWRKGASVQPAGEIAAPMSGRRERAFVSLCSDSRGSTIYAVSSNNHIYQYLTSNFSDEPLDILAAPGFRTSGSFYIRSSMSPNDEFILCGSTEGHAYIWPTSQKRSGAIRLAEHRYEVSCVAWSSENLYVGGEDYVSRIWYTGDAEIDPVRFIPAEKIPIGPKVQTAKREGSLQRIHTGNSKEVNTTPPSAMEPWPSRTVAPRMAYRIPLSSLPSSNLGTPVKKRQLHLDSFLSPSPAKRLLSECENIPPAR
jgi:WD40 repeat protein